MIQSIEFKNFKALRQATLPLNQFTLIVGPNGSGKSTAMQALEMVRSPGPLQSRFVTAGMREAPSIEINLNWHLDNSRVVLNTRWKRHGNTFPFEQRYQLDSGESPPVEVINDLTRRLASFRIFSFDANFIAATVTLQPDSELGPNGSNLAVVLDNLRDRKPERFEMLNEELGRWFPEFDRILFETPAPGQRAFLLRTRGGQHGIRAIDLSSGTLFALTFLTLAYLPSNPSILCFEEPDRGIHPRLLREIRDGMYRLAYPDSYHEQRNPVQVIATTHSPYLVDLYRDHPEEIVLAHKHGQEVRFERLSERPDVNELLQDAPLGEIWFSGILGGVPSNPLS